MNATRFALRRFPLRAAALLVAAAVVASLPGAARAICCPVVPPGVFLVSSGQANLVVRDGANLHLVPNIRIRGTADDFALIVPTPSLPALSPVSGDLWLEAGALTQPAQSRRANAMDCGTAVQPNFAVDALATNDGVTVHSQETVGAFEATIVSSTDPDALTTWLTDNGYLPDATQTAAFAPLVADGWYFTAMKLLPGTPVPLNGWDTSVDPVEFTFAADELEIPLEVLAINVASSLPVTVYAVDDHRMHLPGFDTPYANRISAGEMSAISQRYPTIAGYLASGRMLTRLTRTYRPAELKGTIALRPASTDEETRTVTRSRTVPGDLMMLVGLLLGLAWRSARGRRRAVSAAA